MEYGYQLSSSVSEDKVAEMGWGGRGGGDADLHAWKVLGAQGHLPQKAGCWGMWLSLDTVTCSRTGPQLVALLRESPLNEKR